MRQAFTITLQVRNDDGSPVGDTKVYMSDQTSQDVPLLLYVTREDSVSYLQWLVKTMLAEYVLISKADYDALVAKANQPKPDPTTPLPQKIRTAIINGTAIVRDLQGNQVDTKNDGDSVNIYFIPGITDESGLIASIAGGTYTNRLAIDPSGWSVYKPRVT